MTEFPISDVLSITTGRLVSRDHIDGVYRVLNYMTGESLFTHQLPRAMDEAAPHIVAQHPWLAEIHVPIGADTAEAIFAWLDTIEAQYGATISLEPLSPEDHTSINPIAEFVMRRNMLRGER